MKILFISHSDAIVGGATTSLIYLVKNLLIKDINVKIACNSEEVANYLNRRSGAETTVWGRQPTYFGKVLSGHSKIQSLNAFLRFVIQCIFVPVIIIRQINNIKNESPDIIHLNSCVLLHTAIAANVLGIPVVWHIREGGKRCLRRKIYGKLIEKLAHSIICISSLEMNSFFLEGSKKCSIIYNPVDLHYFNPKNFDKSRIREQFGYGNDDFIVLSLGGSNPRKGPLEILQSIPYLKTKVHFIFAGPSLQKTKLNARFHDNLELYNDKLYALSEEYTTLVKWIGDVEDIAPVIACCDILVFGGITPHFPRPVYEAWSMGKVPVAFNVEGMNQNINDGIDGIIVRDLNGYELASAIDSLRNNEELYAKMCMNGYEKVRVRMDPEIGAASVIDIYKSLLTI